MKTYEDISTSTRIPNTTDRYIFQFGAPLEGPTAEVYGRYYDRDGSIIHVYSDMGDTVVDLSIYGSMCQELNPNYKKE